MVIDKEFLDNLFKQAAANPRMRMNYDMRTSENDGSQRMLNALLPGTMVAVHRHPQSSENIICLSGKMDVILLKEKMEQANAGEGFDKDVAVQGVKYRKELVESERISLDPATGSFGCIVPAGTWHTVQVYVPSVIYEAKDGKYGGDGSESFLIPQ